MNNKSGIYMYVNKINGHKYIGYTNNFSRRYNDHRSSSFNPNDKDYNNIIHKAIRKYGLENFDFIILEECENDTNILKKREQYWIEKYNTYNNREDYNQTPGGDGVGFNNIHIGEDHGRALLTEKEVTFCREEYRKGSRSRDIYEKFFKNKISYSGFLRMWHGQNWKHIMPEVFNVNPHRAKYTEADCEIINSLYEEYNGSLSSFVKTEQCYVGYGTAWKMIHNPDFYKGK